MRTEDGVFVGSGEAVVRFTLGGLLFEYDSEKNRKNIEKHGISFKSAARVFFDYDRIEFYDEVHSGDEDRYDTIGDTSAGNLTIIGNLRDARRIDDILFVVYTERVIVDEDGKSREVTRLISARLATSFERGVYYGKRS
ncbi:MAG: BrnT family toxin [Oscillibacter sp.]|nr:BrnT family toxin [Oscillibacter sp.]